MRDYGANAAVFLATFLPACVAALELSGLTLEDI